MKATLAIVLVVFQAILFWFAWTGDVERHSQEMAILNKEIERVENRCDSLGIVLSTIEQIQGDTIIVTVPQPIWKHLRMEKLCMLAHRSVCCNAATLSIGKYALPQCGYIFAIFINYNTHSDCSE